MRSSLQAKGLQLAIIAGEESGDQLGAALMAALAARRAVTFMGVGGEAMQRVGLTPLFPMHDIAVNGFDAIVQRLPFLLRRIREAADAVIAARPDALIIIDAPEFTHRVAQRVKRHAPYVPVIDYVSPTVWAWRSGRARVMRRSIDLVLALFPFEPAVHARLGGPRCVYVGHPLFAAMRRPAMTHQGEGSLLVLPGSRRGEVDRLMPLFGEVVDQVGWHGPLEILAVPHLRDRIQRLADGWPRRPHIVAGTEAKAAAFERARAALAASGTVTLELAAAKVPMVVAYRLDTTYRVLYRLNRIFRVVALPNMVLANIVLERDAIPAFLDRAATPTKIAPALAPLLADDTAERAAQDQAFDVLSATMAVKGSPADAAAEATLALIDKGDGARE